MLSLKFQIILEIDICLSKPFIIYEIWNIYRPLIIDQTPNYKNLKVTLFLNSRKKATETFLDNLIQFVQWMEDYF